MSKRVTIVGGGAAGFFAAITCAEASPNSRVTILEKGPQFLSKVKISGGGRCNVTHACFEPRELCEFYPRGSSELRAPYQTFQPRDTIEWFETRGVKLKAEADGRMFPTTDSSQTIIDCLVGCARRSGVELRTSTSAERIERTPAGFQVWLNNHEKLESDFVLLATGGCRGPAAGQLATSLGHTLQPPVPSLFTFHVPLPWLTELSGITLPQVEATLPQLKLKERGPLLITHAGLSGPVILKLSAWGARELHQLHYRFSLRLNWLPHLNAELLTLELENKRKAFSSRLVINTPIAPLPSRLWEALVVASGSSKETRWSSLSHSARHNLIQQLSRTELQVTGKTLNQDEFVTCGGVRLSEINFKTMESRICPGLFFAGELLDIDGLTGGFNFQSAWTTGWFAGKAMAI